MKLIIDDTQHNPTKQNITNSILSIATPSIEMMRNVSLNITDTQDKSIQYNST
jgi:hypothetical protein